MDVDLPNAQMEAALHALMELPLLHRAAMEEGPRLAPMAIAQRVVDVVDDAPTEAVLHALMELPLVNHAAMEEIPRLAPMEVAQQNNRTNSPPNFPALLKFSKCGHL